MLHDPEGRPISAGLDGWHSFKLIPASEAKAFPALADWAAMVEAGTVPGGTPLFTAVHASPGGGLPEVMACVPLDVEDLRAWRDGDRSVAEDVVDWLERAYREFLEQVRANRIDSSV